MTLEDNVYAVYFETPQYQNQLYGLYTQTQYDLEKDRIIDVAVRRGLKAVVFTYHRSTHHEELH